jgi:GTP pyrophosphokinase
MTQPLLTKRFDDALLWASNLHRHQLRKGVATPYVAHLLGVASLVLEYGGDEDQAIAALLHDSIEDQGVTDAEISDRFGSRVAAIVRACADADAMPKPPWLERKSAYIEHLRDAEPAALIVSLADKVHNARAIAADFARDGAETFTRFSGGAAGTRWYYQRLADVFSGRFLHLPFDRPDRPGGAGLVRQYDDVIKQFGATREAAEAYEREVFSLPLPVVDGDESPSGWPSMQTFRSTSCARCSRSSTSTWWASASSRKTRTRSARSAGTAATA